MTNENKNPSTGVKGPVITVRLDADQMVKLANMVAKRMNEKKNPSAATEGKNKKVTVLIKTEKLAAAVSQPDSLRTDVGSRSIQKSEERFRSTVICSSSWWSQSWGRFSCFCSTFLLGRTRQKLWS